MNVLKNGKIFQLSDADKELLLHSPPIRTGFHKVFNYDNKPGLPVVAGMAACPHGDETRECAACKRQVLRDWLAWRDGI